MATTRSRADKERNRSHILEVADDFFAERGVSGSMDAIAKLAGVGPGTLYRHFPTREALIEALLRARYDDLFARRDEIARESSDPAEALEQWLEALYVYATAFDGLPEPLRLALSGEPSPLATTCEDFVSATDTFLDAARRAGVARPDTRGRDLFLGVLSAAWVRDAALSDGSSAQAMLRLQRWGWATAPAAV